MSYSTCQSVISDRKLPMVDVDVHTTLLSITSRTTVTQTFVNESDKAEEKVVYVSPLFDGVSIVKFTCTIGDRTIHGRVEERKKARSAFDQAVSQGQTASLLEQSEYASDTFSTNIGNVPAHGKVKVELVYLGEVKQDLQHDGLRLTIPTSVAPRYSSNPVTAPSEASGPAPKKRNLNITVDIAGNDNSFIQKIFSPGHPVSVNIGQTSVTAKSENDEPKSNLAHVQLKADSSYQSLDDDFVLIIMTTDQESKMPTALIETHPTLRNQRAILATLVPKFSLPSISPEIVFVIDRSGSMGGKTDALSKALRVFLKSLRVGVKFNICSFGSSYSFLWKKSKSYDETSLKEAMKFADNIEADMGGTEILEPVQATVANRYSDINLEVLVLTDGDIWQQHELFNYIRQTTEKDPSVRMFSLGIGSDASHSLIHGIARAGNGFAQEVTLMEDLDRKVLRMLKGATMPHVTDYKAILQCDKDGGDELVEIIPTVDEVSLDTPAPEKEQSSEKPTISLFDDSIKGDSDAPKDSEPAPKPALPEFKRPSILQVPHKLSPFYPFERTTVYMLLSEETSHLTPRKIIFKGTSPNGPLELSLTVEKAGTDDRIHCLAARRMMLDLEEHRGWIFDVKDSSDKKSITSKLESRVDDMIERETVQTGLRYGVAGKHCSFVAVENDVSLSADTSSDAPAVSEFVQPMTRNFPLGMAKKCKRSVGAPAATFLSLSASPPSPLSGDMSAQPQGGGLFGAAAPLTTASEEPASVDDSKTLESPEGRTRAVINLQEFDGSWKWTDQLFSLMRLDEETTTVPHLDTCIPDGQELDEKDRKIEATLVAVAYLENKCQDLNNLWELVVEKAKDWLVTVLAPGSADLQKTIASVQLCEQKEDA